MRPRTLVLSAIVAAGILLVPFAVAVTTDTLPSFTRIAPAVALAQPLLTPRTVRVSATNIPVMPEAGTLAVVGTMLFGLAAAVRRTRR